MELPGLAEHPKTRCVFCQAEISWMLIDGSSLEYADYWANAACPDTDGVPWPHEPVSGYNDGFAYEAELVTYLESRG